MSARTTADAPAIAGPSQNTRSLKVLQVGKFYPPHMGGIETHLQALCGELAKSLDVCVLVASDDQHFHDEILDGVKLRRVPTRLTLASTPLCPGLVRALRNTQADIIHIHLPNPMAVIAYLAIGPPGQLVITYHSDTVRQKLMGLLFEPFLHQFLCRSSAIIATSPNYRATSIVLRKYLDRCQVIPYGIALDDFERRDEDAIKSIRQRYGDRLVISVGRLVYYKGFEYLIRAMTQVVGKLLIVGDGPLRESLHKLSHELKVEDKVLFLGNIHNTKMPPYYHAADVFALASVARSEAFGIVQIEAMAAGLPVVNTSLDSGVPFVSLHEQTGLTVRPEDPSALAKAINRLLDDASLRRSLGVAARQRARQHFSLQQMSTNTLALYHSLMATVA